MTAPLILTRPQAAPPTRTRVSPVRSSADGQPDQTHRSPSSSSPSRAPDQELGRIAATATSLAVACLEIFSGVRRSESIARWVERSLLEKIDHRAQLRAELAPAKPFGELSRKRTLQAGNAQVCRVTDTVAEVTVVVRTQNRCRAVAVRLELLTTRWTMTAMQTM